MASQETHDLIARGKRFYENLKSILEKSHLHSFVAIEPESGEYFLGNTLSEATVSARKAYPDRRTFVARVGHRTAIQIGAGM